MTRTYYIVETFNRYGNEKRWTVHKRGIFSTFNIFNLTNEEIYAGSSTSADHSEQLIRGIVAAKKVKPRVVRVLRI